MTGVSPMQPLLRLHDLAVARGGRTVLEAVNLALSPGEALILQGPNGIGKTTLLRVVAGLARPLAGQVEMAPDSAAYAAHADGVKAQMTAAENLLFWAQVFAHPAPRKAVEKAMASLDLDTLADRAAHEISAGQRRRLGLARLLVARRPVWLLDEPTVSLDTASVARFAGLVRAHLAAGGAALIASHIGLGLDDAAVVDLARFRARTGHNPTRRPASFDEAFI